MTTRKLSDEFIKQMHEEYESGLSTIQLGKKYDRNPGTIYNAFKRKGYKTRNHREKSIKYKRNSNYFNEIDTPEKAYWLGLMYADGYVSKKGSSYMMGIALQYSEKPLLEQFAKDMESEQPVLDYTSKGDEEFKSCHYCRLTVSDKQIGEDLIKHGVFLDKTHILKAPNIAPELERHFIRGYYDGDGSFSLTKATWEPVVQFMGTPDITDFIYNHLKNNGLVEYKTKIDKRNPDDIVGTLRYGGKRQAEGILDYMYKDATRFMQRKYDAYQEYLLGRLQE